MKRLLKFHGFLPCALLLAACGGETGNSASDTSQPTTAETPIQARQMPLREGITPLLAWCMESDSEAACRCADTTLREAASPDDFKIYEGMAPTYLARRAAGDDRVAAFQAASAEAAGQLGMSEGELLPITNRIDQQHLDAIRQCQNS